VRIVEPVFHFTNDNRHGVANWNHWCPANHHGSVGCVRNDRSATSSHSPRPIDAFVLSVHLGAMVADCPDNP